MKRPFFGYFAMILATCSGCGQTQAPGPTVIAELQPETPKTTLVERILYDEKRAAKIVQDTIALPGETELAPLAAVYANRLGIQHDAASALKSLKVGVQSDNPLLAALCWRWLVVQNPIPCQEIQTLAKTASDPVVATFAALASGRCGQLPGELQDRMGLPSGSPESDMARDEIKKRTNTLIALAAPYDNGPLAITLVFVEAQRNEWGENTAEGKTRFVADRLRDELLELLVPNNQKLKSMLRQSPAPGTVGLSAVSEYLESPLVHQNRNALYGAVLKGERSLKIAALRAIATVAREPLAEDFGAAASCLEAADPQVRLEAARTFLLLSKRAR